MSFSKLCETYKEKIDQGIPVEIRVHHLEHFYDSIKLNEWMSVSYFSDYNEKLVRQIIRKIGNNSNSKVKVVADYDVICEFCSRRVLGKCDNSKRIKDDLKELSLLRDIELTTYTSSELLTILSKNLPPLAGLTLEEMKIIEESVKTKKAI